MANESFQQDLFLSHGQEDRKRVKVLAETLEALGWSVWWDQTIPTGKRFAKVIEQRLDASKTVVIVWSNNSVDHDWVIGKRGMASREMFCAHF